jgi:hypothetical protein
MVSLKEKKNKTLTCRAPGSLLVSSVRERGCREQTCCTPSLGERRGEKIRGGGVIANQLLFLIVQH